jgi:hypothetical protein
MTQQTASTAVRALRFGTVRGEVTRQSRQVDPESRQRPRSVTPASLHLTILRPAKARRNCEPVAFEFAPGPATRYRRVVDGSRRS